MTDSVHYILVADSGSTKTAWCLIHPDGTLSEYHTQGLNPALQEAVTIRRILQEELLPQLPDLTDARYDIHFYGAGCLPSLCPQMAIILQDCIPHSEAEVFSDLLGAARALCGHAPGIACILGTGANSCYYDGRNITKHVSPLGFILGDEGSGATLGKLFLSDLQKGLLAPELATRFTNEYQLNEADIIRKVYREPGANRFLASLAPFLKTHRKHEDIHRLLRSAFENFFLRNIRQYEAPSLPVNFVGSIAFHFREELEEAATAQGYHIGKIAQCPIAGIADFHLQNARNVHADKEN